METFVDVDEAINHLPRLLEQALAGDDVIILQAGRPLVRLVPVDLAETRPVIGTGNGDFVVPDDFDEDSPD